MHSLSKPYVEESEWGGGGGWGPKAVENILQSLTFDAQGATRVQASSTRWGHWCDCRAQNPPFQDGLVWVFVTRSTSCHLRDPKDTLFLFYSGNHSDNPDTKGEIRKSKENFDDVKIT